MSSSARDLMSFSYRAAAAAACSAEHTASMANVKLFAAKLQPATPAWRRAVQITPELQ
jgi:hypothetical protein